MKILFTGGGTGGHVFPLVAIVREIRRIYPKKDLEFYYLGPKDDFGLIFLPGRFYNKNNSFRKIKKIFFFAKFC